MYQQHSSIITSSNSISTMDQLDVGVCMSLCVQNMLSKAQYKDIYNRVDVVEHLQSEAEQTGGHI